MDKKSDTIKLYTCQRKEVCDLALRGHYFVKKDFIKAKYGSSSELFLFVYSWYYEHASKILVPPLEAQSAVWCFYNKGYGGMYPGHCVLELEVPLKEAVFFSSGDWNRILNLDYLGTEKEREAFLKKAYNYGISHISDALLSPYYPMLKSEIVKSWAKLFIYDKEIKEGAAPFEHLQAGLWQIKRDWIKDIIIS